MIIKIAKGHGTMRLVMNLPATTSEFSDVFSLLQNTSGNGRIRVESVDCPVSNLGKYIANEDVSDPAVCEKLNLLAEKVDAMDDLEAKTCVGALDMTSINNLDDVVRVVGSLKDCIFIHGVTTEKELGRFLVNSGYKGFPESVRPYLDYNAIGIEYHAEHDGAFTGDGYTIRRSSAEPLLTEREQSTAFRVHLWTSGMRSLGHDSFALTLPATDAEIHYAKSALNIEDFEEAAIVKVESPEKLLLENVSQEELDIALLNKIAEAYAEAMKGLDADKLRPALAMEKPTTLDRALDVLNGLENYEVISCSAEEYGRGALQELCGDQEVVDTVDGFIDWKAFGSHMMEADGFKQTECGLIRHVNDPMPEQAMDVQPMQSPFL